MFKTKHELRPHRQQARYNPSLETESPGGAALREMAHKAQIYYQLKLGHTVTGTFLKRVGRRDCDRC